MSPAITGCGIENDGFPRVSGDEPKPKLLEDPDFVVFPA